MDCVSLHSIIFSVAVRLSAVDSVLLSVTMATYSTSSVTMYMWIRSHSIVLGKSARNLRHWKITSSYLTWTAGLLRMVRDQPNSRKKMHDFTAEFLKCVKFHRKFTERVLQIHGPTDVISRCCAIANEEISEQRIFTTLSQD